MDMIIYNCVVDERISSNNESFVIVFYQPSDCQHNYLHNLKECKTTKGCSSHTFLAIQTLRR